MKLGISLKKTGLYAPSTGGPVAPAGYRLLMGRDGTPLKGRDGSYVYGKGA